MTIGERIKTLRMKNNISQEELADKINVSRQTISKWETDAVSPDSHNIASLCECFNVTADYIINGTESNVVKSDKKSLIVGIIIIIVGVLVAVVGIILWSLDDGKGHRSDSTIVLPYEFWIVALAALLLTLGIFYVIKKRNNK